METLKSVIRDIPDFPKEGVILKISLRYSLILFHLKKSSIL